MTTEQDGNDPIAFVARLLRAVNAHDLDGIVTCFAPDYRNETPAHPTRSFLGNDQVRKNWEQILSFVPDLTADIIRSVAHEGTVWSEWEHRGTRRDGSPHLMRGVVIFGVADGRATWARFYLEPVESESGTVDDAVRRLSAGEPANPAARQGAGS